MRGGAPYDPLNMRIGSLNVCPRGIWQAVDSVRGILLRGDVSVLHLQDTKLPKERAKKLVARLMDGLPNYVAFHDESRLDAGSKRGYVYSVMTIVHSSIAVSAKIVEWRPEVKRDARAQRARHFQRLSERDEAIQHLERGATTARVYTSTSPRVAVAGRMLVLEISPPGCQSSTAIANVYMPTGSGAAATEWAAMATLLVKGCRGAHARGLNVVLHGDFNADGVKGQHRAAQMSASAERLGARLRALIQDADLADVPHLGSKGRRAATWRSACGRYRGVIDYGLVSRAIEAAGCSGVLERQREDHVLDHALLLTSVPSSMVGKAQSAGSTEVEEVIERVQWRKLKDKADEFREATRHIQVDENGIEGEGLKAAKRLALWGVQARREAKRLCGVIPVRKPREIIVPPGLTQLRRLQTYLGRWLRREKKLLRRIEAGRTDTQPSQEEAAKAWRKKWGRRVGRASLDDLPLLTGTGGGVTADEVNAKVESLKGDCEAVRVRLWKNEREGRKVSLQEYKRYIRKAFGAGGIKHIMGKRARQQEPWGLSTDGPVGLEFKTARAAAEACR